MNEIVELSSDSNSSDTIILPLNTIDNYVTKQISENENTTVEKTCIAVEDIDTLLKKYTNSPEVQSCSKTIPNSSHNKKYSLEDFLNSGDIEENVDFSSLDSGNFELEPSKSKKRKNCNDEKQKELKELLRFEKEAQKQQKLKEKEDKRVQKERDKEFKRSLLAANKHLKPDDCTKFITVYIDTEIMKEEFSQEIEKKLSDFGIKYKLQKQIFANTITWTRQIQSTLLKDDGNLALCSEDTETEEIILMLDCKNLIEHIHNYSLSTYIQSVKSVNPNKKLILAIYGLEDYCKYRKYSKSNDIHEEIGAISKETTKNEKQLKNLPSLNRNRIDFVLTELQLLCSCSYRSLENPEQVGTFIAQFSKAVAQLPYKLEKQERNLQTEWYMSGDNKDCVKVDKDGNGLNRLWHQQLTTFPLARLETAEAIALEYKTPSSLFEAYNKCSTVEEGELLLQDIPIRRAAGPLTTVRRIGPELSKKVYKFFTSLEGDILL